MPGILVDPGFGGLLGWQAIHNSHLPANTHLPVHRRDYSKWGRQWWRWLWAEVMKQFALFKMGCLLMTLYACYLLPIPHKKIIIINKNISTWNVKHTLKDRERECVCFQGRHGFFSEWHIHRAILRNTLSSQAPLADDRQINLSEAFIGSQGRWQVVCIEAACLCEERTCLVLAHVRTNQTAPPLYLLSSPPSFIFTASKWLSKC